MDSKQVVFITGSSTGFWAALRRDLARAGHTVFATERDPQGKNAKNAADLLALARRESLPYSRWSATVTSDASVELRVRSAIAQAAAGSMWPSQRRVWAMGLARSRHHQQAQQIMDTNFMACVA